MQRKVDSTAMDPAEHEFLQIFSRGFGPGESHKVSPFVIFSRVPVWSFTITEAFYVMCGRLPSTFTPAPPNYYSRVIRLELYVKCLQLFVFQYHIEPRSCP